MSAALTVSWSGSLRKLSWLERWTDPSPSMESCDEKNNSSDFMEDVRWRELVLITLLELGVAGPDPQELLELSLLRSGGVSVCSSSVELPSIPFS